MNFLQFHETYSPKYSANTYHNVLEFEVIKIKVNTYESWRFFLVKGNSVSISIDRDCKVNGSYEDNATQCLGIETTHYMLRE